MASTVSACVFSHGLHLVAASLSYQPAYMSGFATGMVEKELLLRHISRRHVEPDLHYVASAEWSVPRVDLFWLDLLHQHTGCRHSIFGLAILL